jgi:5-enolpyruvylshikimate-3-phosphate synthase
MNKPVFVKIDEYQDVLNIVDVIKANLVKTKATIAQINELKKKEDDILTSWTTSLDDINKKVDDISKTLFEQK